MRKLSAFTGFAAAATALGVAGALAGGAGGTAPGANGKHAFDTVEHHRQIAVANPDGAGWHALTHTPKADNVQPDWSPDGNTIVFERDKHVPKTKQDALPNLNVFVMNADGTNVRKLTHYLKGGGAEAPAWSPDGKTIAFDRVWKVGGKCCVSSLATMAADGSQVHRTAVRPIDVYDLAGARAGTRLAFTGYRHSDGPDGPAAIFTERVDGSDQRQVTPWTLDAHSADWSPDGSRIVFASPARYSAKFASNIFT